VFVRYPPGRIRYEGDRPVALLGVRVAPSFRLVEHASATAPERSGPAAQHRSRDGRSPSTWRPGATTKRRSPMALKCVTCGLLFRNRNELDWHIRQEHLQHGHGAPHLDDQRRPTPTEVWRR
jgi:uncharacterized C2H2 Zn-finger protein